MDGEVYMYGTINNEEDHTHIVYTRRWYIVIIFAMFAMLQGAVSNTWGPVEDSVNEVYGWGTTTIALLSAWNNIFFLICFFPMVWMMMKCGLRKCTVLCTFAMALSTGIRCIPAKSRGILAFAHISAILCGFANTLGMIGPTAVSVTWFPVHERTKATAIVSVSNNNVANAVSFLLAKLIVEDYANDTMTIVNGSMDPATEQHQKIIHHELNTFMYTEFGLCMFVFLAVVMYFPRCPPTTPSSSAGATRLSYLDGFRTIVRMRNLWFLLVPYALPLGIQPAFVTVMDSMLEPYGISQDTSNWIGFYTAIASTASGLVFGYVADKLERGTKSLLIAAIACAGISYGWFLLIAYRILPTNAGSIYASLILGGIFSNGAVPLLYEMACEITYPVSEEVTTGFMTGLNNLAAVIFLAVVTDESLGKVWVLWCLTVAFLISIPSLIAVQANYRRINMDNDDATQSDP